MEEKKAVKVLAVVCQMNRGGLESRLMDIIRQLVYSRICMDVYTYREDRGVFDEEILRAGGTVYYNPPLYAGNMLWYAHYFKRFLLRHPEYRIVHAHQDAWCSVFCKGASLAGVPVRIAHSRTAITGRSVADCVKNVIRLPARRYATHYFAVSRKAGQWLFGEKNLRQGRVQIWKNAIYCRAYTFSPQIRETCRAEMGWGGRNILIHVGNFTPPKNHMFLLDMIECLVRKDSSWMLVLVGGETGMGIQKKTEDQTKQRHLEKHVRILGSREDVPVLLQGADVFCFPSIYEGLPGAVLEAQAAGLPCIVSDSVTEEVKILKSTRRLPLRAGADAWGREIEKALDVKRRDTYQEMRDAGFDIETLTQELTEFYEQAGR